MEFLTKGRVPASISGNSCAPQSRGGRHEPENHEIPILEIEY